MAQPSASPRTPDQISAAELYIATFAPRTDAYVAWNGKNWVAVKEPLTADVIFRAFARDGEGHLLDPVRPVSAYFPDREGMTHIAAIDFDTDDGVQQAHRVARRLAGEGCLTYVEHSRRGAHLWWPFEGQLTAALTLRALRASIYIAGIPADPKIEFRPESPAAPGPDGWGKPLRLPMMVHPTERRAYPVYDHDGAPMPRTIPAFLTALADAPLSSRAKVEAVAKHGPKVRARDGMGEDLKPVRSYSSDSLGPTVTDVARERWGAILKAGKANKCFAHDDRHPSLNVLPDERRLICMSPECILHNNGDGYSAYELARLDIGR